MTAIERYAFNPSYTRADEPRPEQKNGTKKEYEVKDKNATQINETKAEIDEFIQELQEQRRGILTDALVEQRTRLKFKLNALSQHDADAARTLLSHLMATEKKGERAEIATTVAGNTQDMPAALGQSKIMASGTALVQQVRDIVLNNPSALRRPVGYLEPSLNTANPSLAPPVHKAQSLQQLLAALMKIMESIRPKEIDNKSMISDRSRELAFLITKKALKENEALLKEHQQEMASREKKNSITKWCIWIFGGLAAALTGGILAGVLPTITDSVLQETKGFSIFSAPMAMLTEQIGKGVALALKACGAKGPVVEAISMLLASIVMTVVESVAARRINPSSLTRLAGNLPKLIKVVTRMIKQSVTKLPQALKGVGDKVLQQLPTIMKWARKYEVFLNLAAPFMQFIGECVKFPNTYRISQLVIEKSENEVEFNVAETINDLVEKLLKWLRGTLSEILKDRELANLFSDLQSAQNYMNYSLAHNVKG